MGRSQRRHNRTARASSAAATAVRPAQAQTATLSATPADQAMRQLQALAPTLYQHPDLLREAQHVLRQAEARAQALYTGNAWTGIGTPAPDPRALSGFSFSPDILRAAGQVGSPTGSTPQASAPSGQLGGWAGSKDAPKGVMNAQVLRRFSRDPWVFAAKKHLADRVSRAEVAVLPIDYDKPYDKSVERRVTRLLNCPNELRDSYASLMKRVVDDILTLDRGCISKALTLKGRIPVSLYSEDGATIKIYANWAGDPRVPRYLYEEPGSTTKVPLRNDELICIMENETTYSFGNSRMQILMDEIRADIEATQKAMQIVSDKPPPTAIQLPGAGDMAIKQLRADYESLIAGKREVLFMGGDQPMVAKTMVYSLKDQQFLEWQVYLARKICAVMQVSPQSIGITFDINRATAETQQSIEDDAGLIPLLLLIEEYLNRELMWDFAALNPDDGRPDFEALNLGIFFPEISEASRILHIQRLISMADSGLSGLPFMTPNMALEMLGEEPIDGGNTLWAPTTNGPMPWLSYDGETGDFVSVNEGGANGSQEPGSGPAADARDLDDTRQAKPDRSAPSAETPGDETSGNGPQPNLPTDDSSTTSDAGSGGSGAAKSVVPLYTRREYRRPGQAWSASQQRLTRTLTAPRPTQAAQPRRVARAAPAVPALVLAAATGLDPFDVRTAQAIADALQAELYKAAGKPTPYGRIRETAAQAHHRPQQEQDARAQLQAAVSRVFENARQRGMQALT